MSGIFEPKMEGPAIVALLVVGFVTVYLAAKRFEAVQRRKGRWDKYGPIHPTKGPSRTGYWGSGMSERLEVTGQYVPRPIPRELPPEAEHQHKQVD